MCRNDKNKLYELLCDLATEYIDENNIDFDDRDRGENDEIIMSIDTLKEHLEQDL